jgi:hypothetical protein
VSKWRHSQAVRRFLPEASRYLKLLSDSQGNNPLHAVTHNRP